MSLRVKYTQCGRTGPCVRSSGWLWKARDFRISLHTALLGLLHKYMTCRYHPREHLETIGHALRDAAQLVGQLLHVPRQELQLGLGSFDDVVPNLS